MQLVQAAYNGKGSTMSQFSPGSFWVLPPVVSYKYKGRAQGWVVLYKGNTEEELLHHVFLMEHVAPFFVTLLEFSLEPGNY